MRIAKFSNFKSVFQKKLKIGMCALISSGFKKKKKNLELSKWYLRKFFRCGFWIRIALMNGFFFS